MFLCECNRLSYSVDKQAEMAGDDSLMTYRGHQVLKCLIRSRFSPVHVTGQVDLFGYR